MSDQDRKLILTAIIDELKRQGNEDRHSTPYFDFSDIHEAVVDGRIDLEALAEAITKAMKGPR